MDGGSRSGGNPLCKHDLDLAGSSPNDHVGSIQWQELGLASAAVAKQNGHVLLLFYNCIAYQWSCQQKVWQLSQLEYVFPCFCKYVNFAIDLSKFYLIQRKQIKIVIKNSGKLLPCCFWWYQCITSMAPAVLRVWKINKCSSQYMKVVCLLFRLLNVLWLLFVKMWLRQQSRYQVQLKLNNKNSIKGNW